MRGLVRRRVAFLAVTLLLMAVAVVLWLAFSLALHPTERISGWTLFGLVVLLAGYNLRKKLPFLPLLSSSAWLQVHIYGGSLGIVLFLLHIGARVPNGVLDVVLALAFVGVAGSGLVGLFLSRTVPKRLTARGEEVLFERIPVLRRQLREEAERRVLEAAERSGETTLADFYARHLAGFFTGARHFWHHLVKSERPRRRLLAGLAELDRYLGDEERQSASRLFPLIRAKDDLDHHHAHQAILKWWLFGHIGLTGTLLILGLAHGAMAELFSGALS